jgi:hypothetical protein
MEGFDFSQISELVAPYIAILIGLVASLIAKDFANSMSAGLSFKYNPQFNEGDNVLIDDEPATIIKIGYKYTVFSVRKDSGHQTWRYVKNERIPFLKLEKVMRKPTDPDSEQID